jgi:hypothetical protein
MVSRTGTITVNLPDDETIEYEFNPFAKEDIEGEDNSNETADETLRRVLALHPDWTSVVHVILPDRREGEEQELAA